jgi:hypothetical protein
MGVVPGVFLRPMEPAVRKTVQAIVGTQVPANTSVRPAAPGTYAPEERRTADNRLGRVSASEQGLATGAQPGSVVSREAELREGASRGSGGKALGVGRAR